MATCIEVGQALVQRIVAAVYPNGLDQPSVAPGAVRVFQGWPEPQALEQNSKVRAVQVSVFPRAEEQVTVPVSATWEPLQINPPTLTVTVHEDTFTLGGAVSVPQTVIVLVDDFDVAYALQASDTLEHIAQALAKLIQHTRPASAQGPCVTVPGAYRLEARISTGGTRLRTLRMQTQLFQITVWASAFKQREPVAAAIERALAQQFRLPLPDGTVALLRYRHSGQHDEFQHQQIYRRDLFYEVTYALTESASDVTIVAPVIPSPAIC
jgi:hypothetical protein